ncbi:MAG TPA: VCBS repeat-containing protein, partial [Terriglobales bacterium]|nr:VCBS repeat-containing protein [Terriglobales bacterium]
MNWSGRQKFIALALAFLLFSAAISGEQASAHRKAGDACAGPAPQFVDITSTTGIHFAHEISPEKKFIVESMSGGVLLIDYDRDGWLDIYFTNAPTVAMALEGKKARSALYHNNHDGTFTDVTDKAGVGYPGFAMGGAVGDYNNDGWPDIYVTCLGGNVLYRNNGDGTFTDVAQQAGV